MGLTKQYLRYTASAVFGVIGSQKANIAYVTLRGGERGRYVAVAACEHVFIWDARKGEKVRFRRGYDGRFRSPVFFKLSRIQTRRLVFLSRS